MPLCVRQHCGTSVKAPCEIDTPAKRFRLKPRKNPYWVGVSGGRGGLSLGFRRTVKGEGVWVAKIVIDGERVEERIGTPDGDKAVGGALSFTGATEAALAWDKLKAAAAQNRSESSEARKIPTVQLTAASRNVLRSLAVALCHCDVAATVPDTSNSPSIGQTTL